MIDKLETAIGKLDRFMTSQGLPCTPDQVNNLQGDEARGEFINLFKEVQRIKTQLDQYTDLSDENAAKIETILPPDDLRAFRGVYLETAQRLKAQQEKTAKDEPVEPAVAELDFEFVLFASAMIDYDYIMGLIANYTQNRPGKQKMTREQLVGLIDADAKFLDEREDIREYIGSLQSDEPLNEKEVREGYEKFKTDKFVRQIAVIAAKYELKPTALQAFIDAIMARMIFDGEALSDLFAAQELGWKARTKKELALMDDLVPLLRKLAKGRDISGLNAYEN